MVQALPVSKIDLIIDSLLESTHSSIDIQLKILQLLPRFFANYSMFISDESLSKLLLVCSSLQSANKMGAVINTAQATFSQLLNIVFEKVYDEDEMKLQGNKGNTETDNLHYEVPIDNNETKKVGLCAYDAQRIVSDLCTLIEHHKPTFMKTNYLTEEYGFELLEGVIKNNQSLFLHHVELGYLLRIRVAPLLLRFVSSSKDFTVMVRVSRLIFLLITDEFDVLQMECEVTLSLLTHILHRDIGSPAWKKILSLEIFTGILKNFTLVKRIYLEYDHNEDEERKHVLGDFFDACLVMVEENKSLLNAGDIIQPPSQADIQGPPSSGNSNSSSRSKVQHSRNSLEDRRGLSTTYSNVKQCYIDSIDKADPPPVPDTYLLYLVSQAIVTLSEGICKAALDLATSTDEQGNSVISFLDSTSFDKEKQFQNHQDFECISSMAKSYWTVMLDIYRIMLHSTLDNEMFNRLIRSLQKLCHASGILSVDECRTEVLTFFATSTIVLKGKVGYQNRLRTIVGTISSTIGQAVSSMATAHSDTPTSPVAPSTFQLYTRNIHSRQTLCFRALISLGISLAGILDDDWKIILTAMQWISYYIDGPSGINTKDIPQISPYLTNADLTSIENSLTRFTEGIDNQHTEVFHRLATCIHQLSDDVLKSPLGGFESFGHEPFNSAKGTLEPCIYNRPFYINKLTDICEINSLKFLINDDESWKFITKSYVEWASDRSLDDDTRLLATRSFDIVVNSVANSGFQPDDTKDSSETDHQKSVVESKVLQALYEFIVSLGKLPTSNEQLVMDCEVEMNLQSLNTLKGIIDRYGTVIQSNWNVVTAMLNSPFDYIQNADVSVFSKKSLNDTITSVLRSSFETMKAILDEILQKL
ncbi:unnamed protein product [Ambrosiozyma monospora]|uniref:Unnamed protein product n=1 Tax=Ambrosiozyma monospora TaxID=43982 RepID=A0A9W6Z4W8_AMBMO|nr:unnamed protein product [Ambrosiozyma monospora]